MPNPMVWRAADSWWIVDRDMELLRLNRGRKRWPSGHRGPEPAFDATSLLAVRMRPPEARLVLYPVAKPAAPALPRPSSSALVAQTEAGEQPRLGSQPAQDPTCAANFSTPALVPYPGTAS